MGAKIIQNQKKPVVVDYHDYREFLRDWFAYLNTTHGGFSLRTLARQSKIGVSTLSMILNGSRPLTPTVFEAIHSYLRMSEKDLRQLALLAALAHGPTIEARLSALEKIQSGVEYQRRHAKEFETFHYLSVWHRVAIREMAALADFQFDPHWIQERLSTFVPLGEIEKTLEFLIGNGFLSKDQVGRSPKQLNCVGGVYSLALGTFHRQMLEKSADAIDEIKSEDRYITGHTFSLPREKFNEARAILQEALARIEELGAKSESADTVYHAEFALIPLATGVKK